MSEILELDPRALMPDPDNEHADVSAETVTDLAAAISESHYIRPLLVFWNGNAYQVIAGHRRRMAAITLGLSSVPCIARPAPDRRQLDVERLVDNLHADELTPIEKARSIRRLREEHGLTQAQVANIAGIRQPDVSKLLQLLRLPQVAQDLIQHGDLTQQHGLSLLKIDRDEIDWDGQPRRTMDDVRVFFATDTVQRKLSTGVLETAIRAWQTSQTTIREGIERDQQRTADREKRAATGRLTEEDRRAMQHAAHVAEHARATRSAQEKHRLRFPVASAIVREAMTHADPDRLAALVAAESLYGWSDATFGDLPGAAEMRQRIASADGEELRRLTAQMVRASVQADWDGKKATGRGKCAGWATEYAVSAWQLNDNVKQALAAAGLTDRELDRRLTRNPDEDS